MAATFAAVDLGASSGRVIAARVGDDGSVVLHESARFDNRPVALPGPTAATLHWDVLALWTRVCAGLQAAARDVGPLDGVGIDTWAVDYGLLDDDGHLVGLPAAYRCTRTDGVAQTVLTRLGAERVYRVNGLQVQPFNTMFQLVAEPAHRRDCARSALLMPDLFGYWLTGRQVSEVTNASTTGLIDPATRDFADPICTDLAREFDVPARELLPELVEPGHLVGAIRPDVLHLNTATGAPTPLVAVGSHDTASAVVAVPATGAGRFAYISCGTWSLVGLELPAPIRTQASRTANLTNELGVDGTVRYLRNVAGLWIFDECVRTWRAQREHLTLEGLLAAAATRPALRTVLDVDDPIFTPPGDMPARITDHVRTTGEPVPDDPAAVVRCVLDSMALAYRRALHDLTRLADRPVEVVHLVGGGSRNDLLCRLTADATGRPVVAGPTEGTALGNILIQARAVGAIDGDLARLRRIVADSTPTRRYDPDPRAAALWSAAARRLAR